MKKINSLRPWLMAMTLTVSLAATAAEMDHSQMQHGEHGAMDHSQMQHGEMDHSGMHGAGYQAGSKPSSGSLAKLDEVPASGKAREAGYDGRYAMESITANESTAEKCAKGSRGLLMVDNATWVRCGGKPKGWAEGTKQKAGAAPHAGHEGH